MSQTEATRQSDYIRPPRAALCANVSVTTSPSTQDLGLIGYVTGDMSQLDKEAVPTLGLVGHFATFYADGADVGVIFGALSASVASANAPVLATTGVNAAGVCYRIPNGQERSFKITPNDRWVGIVGAGSCTLRIFQSSP